MKKVIYIAGPITDNETGQPREGWQDDFLAAENKLREIGFDVVNPVGIAMSAEEDWLEYRRRLPKLFQEGHVDDVPEQLPRWWGIAHCLSLLTAFLMQDEDENPEAMSELVGAYVIGDPEDIRRSYGTQCEINFLLSAGLPVWSQHYGGTAIDNQLRCDKEQLSLDDMVRVMKSKLFMRTAAKMAEEGK